MADQNSLNDPDPLNDPELDRLERQLSLVTLTPTPGQRERMLFACGQAAGRAQMMRRVRAATALAAVLACVSAGLGFALVARDGRRTVEPDQAASAHVEERRAEPQSNVAPRHELEPQSIDRDQLTAATSFTQFSTAWEQASREKTHGVPASPPSSNDVTRLVAPHVLTAAGRSAPHDLWD
jgi:hypothetical protein